MALTSKPLNLGSGKATQAIDNLTKALMSAKASAQSSSKQPIVNTSETPKIKQQTKVVRENTAAIKENNRVKKAAEKTPFTHTASSHERRQLDKERIRSRYKRSGYMPHRQRSMDLLMRQKEAAMEMRQSMTFSNVMSRSDQRRLSHYRSTGSEFSTAIVRRPDYQQQFGFRGVSIPEGPKHGSLGQDPGLNYKLQLKFATEFTEKLQRERIKIEKEYEKIGNAHIKMWRPTGKKGELGAIGQELFGQRKKPQQLMAGRPGRTGVIDISFEEVDNKRRVVETQNRLIEAAKAQQAEELKINNAIKLRAELLQRTSAAINKNVAKVKERTALEAKQAERARMLQRTSSAINKNVENKKIRERIALQKKAASDAAAHERMVAAIQKQRIDREKLAKRALADVNRNYFRYNLNIIGGVKKRIVLANQLNQSIKKEKVSTDRVTNSSKILNNALKQRAAMYAQIATVSGRASKRERSMGAGGQHPVVQHIINNKNTKAYRRTGMAFTQMAYALDDVQYGLRGVQNNMQQMLVVMGVSGPIVLAATAAIVYLNHKLRDFDFKGWIEGMKSFKDQLRKIELEAAKKSIRDLTDDMFKLHAAFELAQEGQPMYLDEIADKFKHVTDQISGPGGINSALLTTTAILKNMAQMKMMEMQMESFAKRLESPGKQFAKVISGLGVGLDEGGLTQLMVISKLSSEDPIAYAKNYVEEETKKSLARGDIDSHWLFGGAETSPGGIEGGIGVGPIGKLLTPEENAERLKKKAFGIIESENVQKISDQYLSMYKDYLSIGPDPSSASATGKTKKEQTPYEKFMSQWAHLQAILQEMGKSELEIANARQIALKMAEKLVSTDDERLELSRALEFNEVKLKKLQRTENIEQVNNYYNRSIQLMRALGEAESEIIKKDIERLNYLISQETVLKNIEALEHQRNLAQANLEKAEDQEYLQAMDDDTRKFDFGQAMEMGEFMLGDPTQMEELTKQYDQAVDKLADIKEKLGETSDAYKEQEMKVKALKKALEDLNATQSEGETYTLRYGQMIGDMLGKAFEELGRSGSLSETLRAGMAGVGEVIQDMSRALLTKASVELAFDALGPAAIPVALAGMAVGGFLKGKYGGRSRGSGVGNARSGYGGSGFTPSLSGSNHLGKIDFNPIGMDVRISGEDLRIVGAVNNDNNGSWIP